MTNRAYHQHTSCQNHPGLAGLLLFEAYRRMSVGIYSPPETFRRPTKSDSRFSRAMWVEASYCLDAPDILPAGYMEDVDLGPEVGSVPSVATIQRDGAYE